LTRARDATVPDACQKKNSQIECKPKPTAKPNNQDEAIAIAITERTWCGAAHVLGEVAELAEDADEAGHGDAIKNGLRVVLVGRAVEVAAAERVLVPDRVSRQGHCPKSSRRLPSSSSFPPPPSPAAVAAFNFFPGHQFRRRGLERRTALQRSLPLHFFCPQQLKSRQIGVVVGSFSVVVVVVVVPQARRGRTAYLFVSSSSHPLARCLVLAGGVNTRSMQAEIEEEGGEGRGGFFFLIPGGRGGFWQ
jgi:hypothetical protein